MDRTRIIERFGRFHRKIYSLKTAVTRSRSKDEGEPVPEIMWDEAQLVVKQLKLANAQKMTTPAQSI